MKTMQVKDAFTQEESRSLSVIRTVAMLMIILCHYFVAFVPFPAGAQFMNVGVPMFLILSGYLYGRKTIHNTWQWYKKQVLKIVIPTYVYYVLMTLVLLCMGKLGSVTLHGILFHFLNLQGFTGESGFGNVFTGHLWFITFILICYLLTPLLQKLRNRISIGWVCVGLVFLSVLEIFVVLSVGTRAALGCIPYIFAYIFAYFFTAKRDGAIPFPAYCGLSVAMLAGVVLRFLMKGAADAMQLVVVERAYVNVVAIYTHIILAFWIFFTLYRICQFCAGVVARLQPVLSILGNYSFAVYITHQMLMIGVFNVCGLTGNLLLDTLIFILLTVITAYILKRISDKTLWYMNRS